MNLYKYILTQVLKSITLFFVLISFAQASNIKKAKTDPQPLPSTKEDLKQRPEAENLISIFASLQNSSIENVISEYAGKEFSDFKRDLIDLSVSKLGPITTEMNKLMTDTSYIDSVLNDGKDKAINVAEPVLRKTKEIIGFLS